LVASRPSRYYSSMQITIATLIGGPLAGGYLASRNYALFGEPGKGRLVLIVSAVAIIGLLYIGSLLPPQSANSALPFIAVIAYRVYAAYAFDAPIARRKGEGWTQYSWWHVTAISLAILVAMLALIVVALSTLNPRG
jgi:hypothetical protein